MSEILLTPGSNLLPEFGVQIISDQPVLLRVPPTTALGFTQILGSAGNDLIAPLNPNDPTLFNIVAGDGNDTVVGGGGTDTLLGGTGDDVINGGAGDDIILGEAGNDILSGDDGNDNLKGGDGNDRLFGGNGIDLLNGGTGNDTLDGGPGGDLLLGEGGDDVLIGGPGNDSLKGGPGKDRLTGGPGRDEFRFERGSTGGKNRRKADVITDFNPRADIIQLDRRLLKNQVESGRLKSSEFASVTRLGSGDVNAKIIYEQSTGLVYFNPTKGNPIALIKLDKNLNIGANDFEIFF